MINRVFISPEVVLRVTVVSMSGASNSSIDAFAAIDDEPWSFIHSST